ncbi:MAG: TolC family protein [Bacteroidota bacterium]
MKKQLLMLFCSITISVQLFPQQTDSLLLPQLITEVKEANYKLKASRSSVQAARARIDQATMWSAPQVSANFMDIPLTSVNPLNNMEREYSITQMIPFPGKNSAFEAMAKANAEMYQNILLSDERTIVAEIKKEYAMLYSVQRRLDVNAENQALAKQMIAAVHSKYSAGLASQADVLRLENELLKLQNEQATLEQDLRITEGMINTLRAMPTSTPLPRIPEIRLSSFSFDKEELITQALAHRAELAAMKNDVAMNIAELAMVKLDWYPDIMVGGLYRERVGAMPDGWEAMVGISIPIAPWVSGKIGGKVEETKYKIQRSEAFVSDMETMIRFEVVDAWNKARAHWEQVERYRTSIIPNAQQTLDALLAAYQTNKTDFLSLIDSFRMLQMHKMDYYMKMEEYLRSRYELERAVGVDFETNF